MQLQRRQRNTMADIVFPGMAAGGPLGQDYLPANYDLVLYKGDYFSMTLTFKNPDDSPMDLTGYTAQCSIRATIGAAEGFAAELTITPLQGKVDVLFPSSITSDLSAGDYVWDFQLTNPDDNVRTYFAGDVKVYGEITP
jgi:LEA14-like dessication related protein